MDHTLPKLRFSIRQLALVTLVYAFLFAILAALPISGLQILAASWVVTLFVIGDWLFGGSDRASVPILVRAAQIGAKYSTALAFATAVCFAIHVAKPDTILVGAGVDERAVLMVFLGTFAGLSAIGFFAALAASQHYPSAIGLMFLNTPGFTLFSFLIYAASNLKSIYG